MSESNLGQKILTAAAVLGAFLVVGVLLAVIKSSVPAPALNQARVLERKTALAELRDTSTKALGTYEIVDPAKQSVRLTVERAMELTIEEYKNPAAARASLTARADKAAAPPPKAPEQPSQYE